MERVSDLAIVLKTFPYQERDRIVVFLTENHGKYTGMAKGAVHSRRYGGSLDLLACSKIHFVRKPHAEMVRIEEATSHHEFASLYRDFDRLTAASFAAEFCLRLLEAHMPSREMFVCVSNFLFQLDAGMPVSRAVNAFLCKAFKALGYPPSLLRCVRCGKPAHEVVTSGRVVWDSQAGGMTCGACHGEGRAGLELESELLLYFHKLTMTAFKDLNAELPPADGLAWADAKLYRVLSDFLHHHIPGLPAGGLKSMRLLKTEVASEKSC
ncbi:MAG: DNA repair protein RecO [Deltaproteobacteria bacterium]|nr:DNA repair protein RecO [Deltaproteobacteria bacterium]